MVISKKMRKNFIFGLGVVFLLLLSFGTVAAAPAEYMEGEIIVKLKDNPAKVELGFDGIIRTGIESIDALNSKNRTWSMEKILKTDQRPEKTFGKSHGLDRLYLLKIAKNVDIHEAIKKFNKNIDIEYAELNYKVNVNLTPNDPSYSKLWGLHNTGQTGGIIGADINTPEAWDIQTGNNSVVIAVIDTGIDSGHEDLAANMWVNQGEIPGNHKDDDGNGFTDDTRGWDFANQDNDPFDDHGHGTHCAGTIGAVGNNGIGVVGVNWDVKILPIKFLDSSGSGSTAGAISSVNYATLMGVDVMSNSWGGGGFSQALEDAISAANDAGILFVAAAGNSGSDNDVNSYYPSGYNVPNVISVAATDHNDQKASFSCYGAESVDIGAPGVNIYSTVPTGSCSLCSVSGYRYLNGTSMATPHVAGAAGLIKSQFPELTSDSIKIRLLGSADSISSLEGITTTGGRLNVYHSLETDRVNPSAVVDLAASSSTFHSILLNWTATGDDGDIGVASYYDIRYSTLPITDENWETANKVVGEPKPQSSGSVETFTATKLSYDTTYYFALRVIDNVGNFSELSNMALEATTIPITVFEDDMESGINGWTHSGAHDNWELGEPASGPGYAYSGSDVWATNLNRKYGRNNMNAGLLSPSVNLTGVRSTQLTFQHYYHTESYYDGGIVEISDSEGVTWVQITPVGGYPGNALSSGNPLGSVPAYSGCSGNEWHQATFDISDYDGSGNISVRFRFGTDYSVNDYPGWYIDDVAILGEPEGPQPPVADAGSNQEVGDADNDGMESVILDGSKSNDPDGGIASYIWTEKSVLLSEEITFARCFSIGRHVVTLTVIDDDGLEHSDDVVITVNPNQPPVADAGSSRTVIINETLTFDGSASDDPDGTIVSYNWKFGDGSVSSGINATHTYFATGTYEVILTVTDNGGFADSDIIMVTVKKEATAGVVITQHVVKSRWDKRNAMGIIEAQVSFTVMQGSVSQLIFKEITDGIGNWGLGGSEVAVKINLDRYVWDLTIDADNNIVIDFGANGVTLSAGDIVQINKIKLINDQTGSHSLVCQTLTDDIELATDTVLFSL